MENGHGNHLACKISFDGRVTIFSFGRCGVDTGILRDMNGGKYDRNWEKLFCFPSMMLPREQARPGRAHDGV